MSPLFQPTLVPIIALAAILAMLALRGRRPGLAAWCLAVVVWAVTLLLAASPGTRLVGERLLMAGFFVPVAYHHAVIEDRGWSRRPLLPLYGGAVVLFVVGAHPDRLFLRAGGTEPGPWFGVMFALALAASAWPLVRVARARGQAAAGDRERLGYLLVGGFLCTFGGGVNVLSCLGGRFGTAGLAIVLGSLALVAWVVQSARLPAFGRFVEASLRYSVAAAALSAIYLSLVLAAVPGAVAALDAEAAVLLFLLVLVGQPILFAARSRLADLLVPGRGDVGGLTEALAHSEARADHAERLAEVGVLASAVAHEVRNPLGVIAACATVLERGGADAAVVGEIRAQVDRAARFADDLLEYGRPASLRVRPCELRPVVEVAVADVRGGLGLLPFPGVEITGDATVEADAQEIARLVAILVENAALAGARRIEVGVSAAGVVVADDGPGVPERLLDRLFDPFVTGRGRDAHRPGTGLGLAIARGIAARHHGTLSLVPSPSGARFVLMLPATQPLPPGP